jgi:hypothetical protein
VEDVAVARTADVVPSPTRYVWRWLTAMAGGLGALLVADDRVGRLHVVGVLVVAAAVAIVGRSVHVIVTQAFSDARRVFRARHLAACAAVLLATGAFVTVFVVAGEPFRHVFAHGHVTGADLVDAAMVVTALVSLVGAGVAATGAWDARQLERNWYRALPAPDVRRR